MGKVLRALGMSFIMLSIVLLFAGLAEGRQLERKTNVGKDGIVGEGVHDGGIGSNNKGLESGGVQVNGEVGWIPGGHGGSVGTRCGYEGGHHGSGSGSGSGSGYKGGGAGSSAVGKWGTGSSGQGGCVGGDHGGGAGRGAGGGPKRVYDGLHGDGGY
ncbi:hypothetical protein BVRB_5g108030 [Beta vulgaris subsp. vulgaris]|uniref:glycine-rich cell wall structural protein n=1 Tax=Beta vulgaris subsp. vulgaris TaxID=3555 RepID=UPI00065C5686|nr:glycine-rich cell wall structural protein [Beta vulgaris subsp. vulgaris]KMT11479.1 hypothetical protein BVRB_5g108030 [Beta vulgaris subsp. vulgaris]